MKNMIEIREEGMVISSERYPLSVTYVGTEGFPDIGVEYIYAQYATADWHEDFFVDRNNIKYLLSSEQCETLEEFTASWIQPLGQEGNPTPEQIEKEKQAAEKEIAQKTLDSLTVTTQSGKVFYADTEARIDLQVAIETAKDEELTETYWKLAEEFEGARIVLVTLDELKEASKGALTKKAGIVGVA